MYTRFMNCMSVCRYDTIPSRVWPTALSTAQTRWPAAAATARISGGAPAAAHRVKEFKTASSSQGVIFMIMALVRTVVSLLKICPASYSATQNILLWCRFCADETKQKHLVIFFSLGKKISCVFYFSLISRLNAKDLQQTQLNFIG